MKILQVLKVTLIMAILLTGLFGCSTTPPPSADDSVGQSDMSQQGDVKDVSGVSDDPLKSEAIPRHEDMAGLENIYFDFDQFTLSSEARQTLGNNAKYLQSKSDMEIVIEGHTDERGSDEYNLALGESRALAAKNYLVSLGINPRRLSVISYGEEKPAKLGSNEEAWAKNRRAEFKVVR